MYSFSWDGSFLGSWPWPSSTSPVSWVTSGTSSLAWYTTYHFIMKLHPVVGHVISHSRLNTYSSPISLFTRLPGSGESTLLRLLWKSSRSLSYTLDVKLLFLKLLLLSSHLSFLSSKSPSSPCAADVKLLAFVFAFIVWPVKYIKIFVSQCWNEVDKLRKLCRKYSVVCICVYCRSCRKYYVVCIYILSISAL